MKRSATIARFASVASMVLALAGMSFGLPAVPSDSGGWSWKLVVGSAGVETAKQAVEQAGGKIVTDLPIIDGVSAKIPRRALSALRHSPLVRSVTDNDSVRVMGSSAESGAIQSVYVRETRANWVRWAGYEGQGIRVALIDTGVTEVDDLRGRIVPVPHPADPTQTAPCVNFSGEPSCHDTYGHGTFIAGLIAGDGTRSSGVYTGIAPKAEIVSIKIAGKDGSADVTKVLAAIQWVVSFRERLGIRVLNLSLGTNSRAPTWLDPLNFAVQRAWLSGIVVVVSAGNLGPNAGTISKPADDPFVISVGAVDDRETPAWSDDRLPNFSSRGPTAGGLVKPDIVAPGGRVISLRAPGSRIGALPGGIDEHYRRGSGTSMSAGIVSGVVALVLDRNRNWTPDRVKFALASTANQVADGEPNRVGAGIVDAAKATFIAPEGLANQGAITLSSGTGSLDESRADVLVTSECAPFERVVDPQCDRIHGNETGQGGTFDAHEFADRQRPWTPDTWYESQWAQGAILNGYSWYESQWFGYSWFGYSWYGSSWYGENEGSTSYGQPIEGSGWYGAWL